MVVLAGQATDGLATVQVRWWSALCAAAVPSGTTAAAPPPSVTLVSGHTAAHNLATSPSWRMGGRCLDTGMSVASTLAPRSIDFCVTCVKLSQDSREERRPSPPRRPPARPGPVPAGNTRKPDGEVSARDVDQSQAAVLRKARRSDGRPANQRASFKSRHQRQKEYYDDLNVRYRLSTVAG